MPNPDCVACGGSGLNSKGGPCAPCSRFDPRLEGPEVEVARTDLARILKGRSILAVKYLTDEASEVLNLEQCAWLRGKSFLAVNRAGVSLIVAVTNGVIVADHPRWRHVPAGEKRRPKGKFMIVLDDRSWVVVQDGTFYLLGAVTQATHLQGLGPDPLDDKKYKAANLKPCLEAYQDWAISAAVAQPHVVAGLGDLYVSEACYIAGLHPLRRVDELTSKDWDSLAYGIRRSLLIGYRCHGRNSFVSPSGKRGVLQVREANVWRREACTICGAHIATNEHDPDSELYWCPFCQPFSEEARARVATPALPF